jgi:uncharacterized membrane protein YbhN (UPF0104 family)
MAVDKKHLSPKARQILAALLRWGGTLASTALFAWLVSRQKWDIVLEKAAGIALWALLLAPVFYLLSFGFNTLRWCILLWAQQVEITYWQALRLNWAANFTSNFLPSTIGGDGFRMLAVHRYTGRKTISIGSVALDRMINMAAMACLLPAPFIVFGASLGRLFPSEMAVAPPGLQKLFERFFPKLLAALRAWAARPWAFFYAFLAAWPSDLLPMSAAYLLARQLGLEVNFWQVLSVQTVSYFLSMLPISVNGYGLREVAYTTLYVALGATLEQASTLALITRFFMVLVTVPGAVWLSQALAGADKRAGGDLLGEV